MQILGRVLIISGLLGFTACWVSVMYRLSSMDALILQVRLDGVYLPPLRVGACSDVVLDILTRDGQWVKPAHATAVDVVLRGSPQGIAIIATSVDKLETR